MYPERVEDHSRIRADAGTVVEVRVPADADQLAVLRAAVGAVAIKADFDVDRIADAQMLVDELCSVLVDVALPDTRLTCAVDVAGSQLGLHGSVAPRPDTVLGNAFGWRVLEALSESLRYWTTCAERPDGRTANIEAWTALP